MTVLAVGHRYAPDGNSPRVFVQLDEELVRVLTITDWLRDVVILAVRIIADTPLAILRAPDLEAVTLVDPLRHPIEISVGRVAAVRLTRAASGNDKDLISDVSSPAHG